MVLPGGVAVQQADPSRAEKLLAEYIEQRLAGRGSPTLERLCARHTELAGTLRELVREYEGVRALVEGPSGSDLADQETLGDGGARGRPSHARASGPDRPEIGSSVGHLKIVGHLGSGGMGEVFVAEDERLRRRVALKSIRANKRMSELTRNRFLR
ncbi:MAG TPA: hypothetical protein VMV46_05125, partial [Thermoanaerobaculia bacterium]|nr:hypothetical protein [Thermoanaerobaculia bacterium]